MKLFRWQKGRQEEGEYRILPLIWSKFLKLDCFLIKFPTGSYILPHKDETKNNRRHYRLNIILCQPKHGGVFKVERTIFSLFNRIHFFRPDLYEHEVTKVEKGFRLVLSIGKTLKWKVNLL